MIEEIREIVRPEEPDRFQDQRHLSRNLMCMFMYTPLNALIDQILHATGNKKYVRKPYPSKYTKLIANRSKRCNYH